jgi:hypothetical protein
MNVLTHIKRLKNLTNNRLRRHIADESGVATVGLMVTLPVFLMVFCWIAESGIMMLRWAMLERGLDMATRELRIEGFPTALATPESRNDYYLEKICSRMLQKQGCKENLYLDYQAFNVNQSVFFSNVDCSDTTAVLVRAPNPLPVVITAESYNVWVETENANFQSNYGEIVRVQACVIVRPFTPHAFTLPWFEKSKDGVALMANTIFIAEPE